MSNKQITNTQQQRINIMRGITLNEDVVRRANEMLGREAGTFLSSCLDLYSSDLTNYDPMTVMAQCMKAAALRLPIVKSLGFAYIIPYKGVPTFQIGYKGLIQLAQRTGQYKYINADVVYEGESVTNNRITGMVEISGEATSEKAIGYFAYFQLLNGFEKCIYWSKERVTRHAERYSKSYHDSNSAWKTNFDEMAIKTVLSRIISKYGIMSVEFATAISSDYDDNVEQEINDNANKQQINLPSATQKVLPSQVETGESSEAETYNESDRNNETNDQAKQGRFDDFAADPNF